jgi:hypothetical protein
MLKRLILTLMSSTDLRKAATEAGIANFHIETVRLGPWSSNLLLIAVKNMQWGSVMLVVRI